MAIQLRSDLWTQFAGDEVESLVIHGRRIVRGGRYKPNFIKVTGGIEHVLISSEYLGEFDIQIFFDDYLTQRFEPSDPMELTMVAGWRCRGRVHLVRDNKVLLMRCPAFYDNGMPEQMVSLRPPVKKPLPSLKGTFLDPQKGRSKL